MSNSIAPILHGLDYQGRFFLKYAAQLLMPNTNIDKIEYESEAVRAFDDVVVHYKEPVTDEKFGYVDVEYFQLKFKCRQEQKFTCESLMDPALVNASSISILKRLRDAFKEFEGKECRPRFTIVSPIVIGDDLLRLMDNTNDKIDLCRLFDGKKKSSFAEIRKKWSSHLEVSEEELKNILECLRLRASKSMNDLLEEVDAYLGGAGLKPWNHSERSNKYDSLVNEMVKANIKIVCPKNMRKIFAQEGFIIGEPLVSRHAIRRIGIRAFLNNAQNMASETDDMLCLASCFSGRNLKESKSWFNDIYLPLKGFLDEQGAKGSHLEVLLEAHQTIAFATGWIYDSKVNFDIAPIQSGNVWRPQHDTRLRDQDLWDILTVEIAGRGNDLAVLISISNNVVKEAKDYIERNVSDIGRILALTIAGGTSKTAVKDGTQAFRLAERAIDRIVEELPRGDPARAVHIYMSAPNAFVFFLGRLAKRLNHVVLYEHDFHRRNLLAYTKTLTLKVNGDS